MRWTIVNQYPIIEVYYADEGESRRIQVDAHPVGWSMMDDASEIADYIEKNLLAETLSLEYSRKEMHQMSIDIATAIVESWDE